MALGEEGLSPGSEGWKEVGQGEGRFKNFAQGLGGGIVHHSHFTYRETEAQRI